MYMNSFDIHRPRDRYSDYQISLMKEIKYIEIK